jgi:hypothetical protein
MTLPARFSLLHSEFNRFLFASIGDEGNEMPLSVFSALTRLDIDPWQEAARLSKLSRSRASQALASTITRLPNGAWTTADAEGIAERLVELLPGGATAPQMRRMPIVARRAPIRSRSSLWLCGFIAVTALLVAVIAAQLWWM